MTATRRRLIGAMASLVGPPQSSRPVHPCASPHEETRRRRKGSRRGTNRRILKSVTCSTVFVAYALAANAFVPLSLQSSHRASYHSSPPFCLLSVTSSSQESDSLSPAAPSEANNEQESGAFIAETSKELEGDSVSGAIIVEASKESALSPPIRIAEVDVHYGSRTSLVYDPVSERYIPTFHPDDHVDESKSDSKLIQGWRTRIVPRLRRSFLPEGVYPSYYRFIQWRILQRFVNANVHVFGTQSLLMGLGLKSHSLGLSAALNWVLKDALGKIVRMGWASKMGRKFDSDAKRWRFRSSLVFALGNALEIITYIFPSLFLVWATLANCCKQTSMLTSSSTRTAIYNSFRDGKRENIGDITAKGEAQIAVVDLLGIVSGVTLSKMVGMSVRSVLGVYIILQAIELFCLYHEIRAVEFRVLNFERLVQLVTTFIDEEQQGQKRPVIPTPQEMARTEKIFLPPKHLTRRAIAFGSLGRAKLAPDELEQLLQIFYKEKFLLVVGADVKNRRRRRGLFWLSHQPHPEDQCHIVLHTDATNVDIVKSTLALSLLRQALAQQQLGGEIRSRDCMELIESSYLKANRLVPSLLKSMSVAGWAPPARFMFGRVKMRADWPLAQKKNDDAGITATIE